MKIPQQQLKSYRISAKRREQTRLANLEKRRQKGLELAKEAARLLKEQFGASQVILFGSLLTDKFHETSDIDLAVSELPENRYFQAVGCLLGLGGFDFDLVEISQARPEILQGIAQGVVL